MPVFTHSYDAPFTIQQSCAAGQNFAGTAPAGAAGVMDRGVMYPQSATGAVGLYTFNSRHDLAIIRIKLDLPGDQTAYTVEILEDGLATTLITGGIGITDVIDDDPHFMKGKAQVRVTTVGAAGAGTITGTITVVRWDSGRLSG